MSHPRVAILYLCHGNMRHIPDVVTSLSQLTYPKDRLTVLMLPAGSPDGIADYIRAEVLPRSGKDLPEVIMIDEPNRGFAANNNVGIRFALEHDFDYVFLHNGDLKLDPRAIDELVALAESSPDIASVQCMVRYWHQPDMVNVSGGVVHIAGYGYARDNRSAYAAPFRPDGDELAYASGAALLLRASVLRKLGLLEEGFFMYHEDLELGMRLRFAGYRNVLAAKAFAFHDYTFSRNQKMFAWIECYRWVVLLAYFRSRTLLVFAPLLLAVEVGTWFMAWRGGWLRAKCWALREWCRPATWRLMFAMRRRAQSSRVIGDKDFLCFVTGRIENQEVANGIMDRVNPAIDAAFVAGRSLIRW
ncbi:MAG: glycosyltransferase family 2 protein [Candidatus Uhrbacteria bacterium]|nr:glycosyltransferase family 2 protein [Candidatus Uhrbacteria bacterium]